MNNDSQRGAETEVIELIANLIASYSHHNELAHSIDDDIKLYNEKEEDIPEELIKEVDWHQKKMEQLLSDRRKAMQMLKNMAKEPDMHMWCLVKHSIACYQFSQELLNTDMDCIDYITLADNAYRYMYECVSKFLWVELVTCWRCLKDALDENK